MGRAVPKLVREVPPGPGSAHGLSPSRGVARSHTRRSHGGPMGSAGSFVDVILPRNSSVRCILAPAATGPLFAAKLYLLREHRPPQRAPEIRGNGVDFIGLRVPAASKRARIDATTVSVSISSSGGRRRTLRVAFIGYERHSAYGSESAEQTGDRPALLPSAANTALLLEGRR
jgi:hypothetical protein